MSTPKTRTKRTKLPRSVVISATITAVVLGLLIVLLWQPLVELASNSDQLKLLVKEHGVLGPLIFIGVQLLQVLIAPIPGQVVSMLSGALFGPWLGTLYSMLGMALGFTLIFLLAKNLGRPFVERFVSAKYLDKFDYVSKTNGPVVLFLIFLTPFFPDDIISLLAGLSPIRIRTLMLVSLAGRLPGTLVLALLGSGIADADARLIVSIVTILLIIGMVCFWQRARIDKWVRSLGDSDNTAT